MGMNVEARMAAHRTASIEHDDNRWDAAEVSDLAALARTEDGFDKSGVDFMVRELESDTAFEPEARKQLFEVLVAEAKVDPRKLKGAPPDVVLAVQAGNSNKFYTMSVHGAELTTRYGRIGTDGKTDVKAFGSEAEARAQMMSTLRGKLKKGYAPVEPEAIGLAVAPAPEPAAGFDLAAWQALPADKRNDMVEGYGALPPGVKHEEFDYKDLKDPAHLAFAKQMRDAAADATGDFEVHDDEYLIVGSPTFTVGLLTAADGTILGGTIRAFQQGCEQPDDYWDNEDEYDDDALQALADDTDVSWQVHGHYSVGKDKLETLREPDYMEWSGY